MYFKLLLVVILSKFIIFCDSQKNAFQKFFMNQNFDIRKRISEKKTAEICYESLGCFNVPRKFNPLQKIPEHPDILETQFYLFRRNTNITQPEILSYKESLEELSKANLNYHKPLKIIIHGYKSKWNEVGAITGVKALLDIDDSNVVLVNWERGANNEKYATSAANTEVVGRQLGLLLLNLIKNGLHPSKIHLIGFSLGAHVAACASEQLKQIGILIERITGLDPASPLFKLDNIRDKKKKLDISDAKFVDVIHTDGSPVFTDGFGILEPLGHVDFFPNGGREQPGCKDLKNSIVQTQLDKTLDREVACSHIRSYRLFLETLLQKASNYTKCEFLAYPCKNIKSFETGNCFPTYFPRENEKGLWKTGKLGIDSFGKGPLYLSTRNQIPFCGTQLRATVITAPQNRNARGSFKLIIPHGKEATIFKFNLEFLGMFKGKEIHSISVADMNNINENTGNITAILIFIKTLPENRSRQSGFINIDTLKIQDIFGNIWKNNKRFVIFQNTISKVVLEREI